MSAKEERTADNRGEEEVGAVDPRRGPIPTEAPEDESGVDTRDLKADKKEADETKPETLRLQLEFPLPQISKQCVNFFASGFAKGRNQCWPVTP